MAGPQVYFRQPVSAGRSPLSGPHALCCPPLGSGTVLVATPVRGPESRPGSAWFAAGPRLLRPSLSPCLSLRPHPFTSSSVVPWYFGISPHSVGRLRAAWAAASAVSPSCTAGRAASPFSALGRRPPPSWPPPFPESARRMRSRWCPTMTPPPPPPSRRWACCLTPAPSRRACGHR